MVESSLKMKKKTFFLYSFLPIVSIPFVSYSCVKNDQSNNLFINKNLKNKIFPHFFTISQIEKLKEIDNFFINSHLVKNKTILEFINEKKQLFFVDQYVSKNKEFYSKYLYNPFYLNVFKEGGKNKIISSKNEQKISINNLFFDKEYNEFLGSNLEKYSKENLSAYIKKIEQKFEISLKHNNNLSSISNKIFCVPEIQTIISFTSKYHFLDPIFERQNNLYSDIRSQALLNDQKTQENYKKLLNLMFSQYDIYDEKLERKFDHIDLFLEKGSNSTFLKVKIDFLDKNNLSILKPQQKKYFVIDNFKNDYRDISYPNYTYTIDDQEQLFNEYVKNPRISFQKNLLEMNSFEDLIKNLNPILNLNSQAIVKLFYKYPNIFNIDVEKKYKEDKEYKVIKVEDYYYKESKEEGVKNTKSLVCFTVEITKNDNKKVYKKWYSPDFDSHQHLLNPYYLDQNISIFDIKKENIFGVGSYSKINPIIKWPEGKNPLKFFKKNIEFLFNFFAYFYSKNSVIWKENNQKDIENCELWDKYQDSITAFEYRINAYLSNYIFADFKFENLQNDQGLKPYYLKILKLENIDWTKIDSGALPIKFLWIPIDKKQNILSVDEAKKFSELLSDTYYWYGFKGTNFSNINKYIEENKEKINEKNYPNQEINIPFLIKK